MTGVHARTVALTGLPGSPRLHRVVDRESGAMDALPSGIVLSRALGLLDMVHRTKRQGGRLVFISEHGNTADVVV